MRRGVDPEVLREADIPDILKEFDVEDDGSYEWNYIIDFIGVVSPAIEGCPVDECLRVALMIYLDSMFNSRARAYGDEAGRAVSAAEVLEKIKDDLDWGRVLGFVDSL
jgi:hypothetical protein